MRNDRIRKITASTGIISTFAGGAPIVNNAIGDGGLATSAGLSSPSGIATDAVGNVYISDYSDGSRIRKITVSTGIITTVAGGYTPVIPPNNGDGGPATSAFAGNPYGLCVAPNGDIYFADSQYIRKVTVSTGIITSLAGTGTWGFSGDGGLATLAQFENPNAVSLDVAGNVYIADVGNHRIRKITISTGIMSTFAGSGAIGQGNGTGIGGFAGDGGLATSALMFNPNFTFFDANGGMFIADSGNSRIRYVSNCASSVISPSVLANGALNTTYTQTISQTGFVGTPITGLTTWSITAGTLPAGLSLVSGTGIIAGTPTAIGTSNFTVKVVSGGCVATKAYSIVVADPATSIDNSLSNLVKVSPNPSNSDFSVDFSGLSAGKSLVCVYDAQGKTVFSSEINGNNGNNTMKISLKNAPNGIYLLQISTEKGNILKRIQKAD